MSNSNTLIDPTSIPTRNALFFTAYSIFAIYSTTTTSLLYIYRRDETIKHRPYITVMWLSVSTSILALPFLLGFPFGNEIVTKLPCSLEFWLKYIFTPLWNFNQPIRALFLLLRYQLSQMKLQVSIPKTMNDKKVIQKEKQQRIVAEAFFRYYYDRYIKGSPNDFEIWFVENGQKTFEQLIQIITITFFILNTCFAIVSYYLLRPDYYGSCKLRDLDPMYILEFVKVFIFAPFGWFVIRNVDDVLGVRKELMLSYYVYFACFTSYFLYSYLVPDSFKAVSYINNDTWIVIMGFTIHFLAVTIPLFKIIIPQIIPALSSKKQRHNRLSFASSSKNLGTNLSNDFETFRKTMSNPDSYNKLKTLAAKEFCTENFIFLEELFPLLNRLGVPNPLQKKENVTLKQCVIPENVSLQVNMNEDFINLIGKYLRNDSPYELNVPDEVRKSIIMQWEKKTFVPSSLNPLLQEVLRMIYANTFYRYQSMSTSTLLL